MAEGTYEVIATITDVAGNSSNDVSSNELVIDIYLKPVRTAEFILVNFYASRTDANFQELVQG